MVETVASVHPVTLLPSFLNKAFLSHLIIRDSSLKAMMYSKACQDHQVYRRWTVLPLLGKDQVMGPFADSN